MSDRMFKKCQIKCPIECQIGDQIECQKMSDYTLHRLPWWGSVEESNFGFFFASASFILLPPAGECAIRRRWSCGPGRGALRYHFIVFHVCLLVGDSVFNHWQDQSLDELSLNLSISQARSVQFCWDPLGKGWQGWIFDSDRTIRLQGSCMQLSHSSYGTCLLAVARGICNSRCSATDFWRRFDQSLQGSQSLLSGFALIIYRRKD